MAWSIELSEKAEKSLAKLGSNVARRIAKTMREIAQLTDPQDRGEALTGNLAEYWRYRVGDWRVIVRFEDGPAPRDLVLLADASLVLEPYLYRRAAREGGFDLCQRGGKAPFLKASIAYSF